MVRKDEDNGFKGISDISVNVELLPLSELPVDLAEVLEYWKSIVPGDCIGPTWKAFDLMRVPPRYLPTAVVVDYDRDTNSYCYRYWGSRLKSVFGSDLTNKTFENCPGAFREVSYASYGIVVKQKEPCLVQFRAHVRGHETTFQTAFRMPLFNDGQNVSGVVSLLLLEYNKYEWSKLWE